MSFISQKVAKRYLAVTSADANPDGQYGGMGPFNLPDDHVAAIQVPKGGACCQKCSFVDVENHACSEPNYIAWNGGDSSLPALPLDEICSDWFQASSEESENESSTQQE